MCPSRSSCKLFHAALCVLAFGVLAGCGKRRPPIDVSGVDLPETQVSEGTLARVLAWYDNEWGFSNRMLDTAAHMGNLKSK